MPGYKSVFVEATGVRASALWTNVGGTATLATAVADNSDSSYMDQAGLADWELSFVDFDVGNVALPAGAKIDSVHSHLRAREMTASPFRTFPQNWLVIIQHLGRAGRMYATRDYLNADPGVFTDYQWGHDKTPDGKEWTQEDVNNLILSVAIRQQNSAGYANLNWEVARARFEVWYNERPTVTVSAPTGAAVNTIRPTVVYAYADPEGDRQVSHHVKVASAAQYNAAGFSWDTSPVTWDSKEEFSGFGERIIGVDLANNTTYRAAVKVRQDWSRSRHESTWVTSEFTVSIAAPATPTQTVTTEPAATLGPRVKIDLSGTVTTGATAARFEVERWDTAAEGWVVHPRLTVVLSGTGAKTATVYDYELPSGQTRWYRSRLIETSSGGLEVASAYTSMVSTSLTFTSAWLKDVKDFSRNVQIRSNEPEQREHREDQGVFWPIGRRTPLVVAGDLRSAVGSFTAAFLSDDDWKQFQLIRSGQRTLLYQQRHGGQVWVRLSEHVEETIVVRQAGRLLREVTVGWVEVDPL